MNTSDTQTYEFRVAGHLDDHWSAWFEDLTIARHDDGTSTLTAPVADQAQLHGILAGLRDIGARLLSLQVLGARRAGPGGRGISWSSEVGGSSAARTRDGRQVMGVHRPPTMRPTPSMSWGERGR